MCIQSFGVFWFLFKIEKENIGTLDKQVLWKKCNAIMFSLFKLLLFVYFVEKGKENNRFAFLSKKGELSEFKHVYWLGLLILTWKSGTQFTTEFTCISIRFLLRGRHCFNLYRKNDFIHQKSCYAFLFCGCSIKLVEKWGVFFL